MIFRLALVFWQWSNAFSVLRSTHSKFRILFPIKIESIARIQELFSPTKLSIKYETKKNHFSKMKELLRNRKIKDLTWLLMRTVKGHPRITSHLGDPGPVPSPIWVPYSSSIRWGEVEKTSHSEYSRSLCFGYLYRVIKGHKIRSLQQHTCIISKCLWVRSLGTA